MIRTCSPDDKWIGDGDKRCGMKFDDSEKSTICPHPSLAEPITEEEIDAIIQVLNGGKNL